MKKIILGSNSPRRRELLAGLDIDFTVDTGNTFEERLEPGVEAHQVPVQLSAGKSHGFHRPLAADEVLITSDTVVIVDQEVLGKPHSREEAVEMLRNYIDKYRPYDKAGAYGIQEWIGYVGISAIEGSFYNVMGFPVHRVWHALQRFL